jgi:membrane associated rhomboid family serine protease
LAALLALGSSSLSKMTENAFKTYIPVLTSICCLISIGLFIGINLDVKLDEWEVYKRWGAPSSTDIFNGNYWGLITSNFLHTEIWHIAFNLYWLWILGKKIEFETSRMYFGILILTSAMVSSAGELAFSGSTGIGLSGIGYSLFGYIFLMGKTKEEYKNYLGKQTVNLFFVWLVVCIFLTQTETLAVGNAAHICGLLWGIVMAYTSRLGTLKQWAIGVAVFTLIISSIFWTPFSTARLSHRAYELHSRKKVEEAIQIYTEILHREPDNEFAKGNLRQIEIQKLSQKAYEFHSNEKYDEARVLYNRILVIDNDNKWARENLNMLVDADSMP